MTDRELLEMSAKAAGVDVAGWNDGREPYSSGLGLILESNVIWNPLISNGDALALTIKLNLMVDCMKDRADVIGHNGSVVRHIVSHGADPYAATRRAIVRAAAEIGCGIRK